LHIKPSIYKILSLPKELNPNENGHVIFHWTGVSNGFGASLINLIPLQN